MTCQFEYFHHIRIADTEGVAYSAQNVIIIHNTTTYLSLFGGLPRPAKLPRGFDPVEPAEVLPLAAPPLDDFPDLF
jgi:hypothetical protein